MNHSMNDLESMNNFVHRTFNSEDLKFFIKRLKIIYTRHQSLESLFIPNKKKFLYNNTKIFKFIFLYHILRERENMCKSLQKFNSKTN